MASTGSFATKVDGSNNSTLNRKLFSVALFAQTQKAPGFARTLTGPAPSAGDTLNKMRGQTSPDMPIVRVTDLSKTQGGSVSVDMFGILGGKPVMGDSDAEGTGAALTSASMDIAIDNVTKVVDVGGRMAGQRTVHDLRAVAMANLTSYFARFDDQSSLVHLAGARGDETNTDWVVPLASDGDFATIMTNTVKCPTRNRHFTISSTGLAVGGDRVVSGIATTDLLKLVHLDALRLNLDEAAFSLQPVRIADDPAAADEPMWVMYLSPRQYSTLLQESTSNNNIRAFQQNAWNRASYGSKHPLFKGEVGMWNGILVKKLNRAIRFNSGNTAYKYVTSANKATETETTASVAASITASFAVDRAILLGAQALGNCYGKAKSSDYHFGWLENEYNLGRNLELGGEVMGGKAKLRFKVGADDPTDQGVICVDSVVAV